MEENCHWQSCLATDLVCDTIDTSVNLGHWFNSGTADVGTTNCFLLEFEAHRIELIFGTVNQGKICGREIIGLREATVIVL